MQEFWVGKIDLSQIECRILNTIAGQWDVVTKFKNKVDTYSELASKFYGFPVNKTEHPAERGTGKQLELSCGYGAGGPSIVRTARSGTYGPSVILSQSEGLRARDLYRGTHPCVPELWKYGGNVLYALYNGQTMNWPLSPDGVALEVRDHRIFHPVGGLWLDYSSLEWHTNQETGEKYWRYRVRDGWRKMYGGRLIENIVQWLASFPIRYRMVQINRELGFRIPLTVHDDIFMLVERSEHGIQKFERAKEIMRAPLKWLPECPIDIEGELMDALDK
jgi:DNA polymerase